MRCYPVRVTVTPKKGLWYPVDDDHVEGVRLRLSTAATISQAKYEHRKPWWNDTDRGNIDSSTRDLEEPG